MAVLKVNDDIEVSLRLYMADISRYVLLSPEEEVQLSSRIKEGDIEALGKMVKGNLRFVICIALEYQNRGLSLPDLIGAGNIGLITAAHRFDGKKGYKFISYAVWWIRQSIQQTLKEQTRLVRLPSNRLDLLSRILQYARTQHQEFSRHPNEEEIAAELGVSPEMVKDTLIKGQTIASLDAGFGEDDKNSLMRQIADETEEPPDAELMRNSRQADIQAALDSLDEREREILNLYFGLDGAAGMTLKEIGQKLALTRERIRQIKEKALLKLRNPKRARKLLPYVEEI